MKEENIKMNEIALVNSIVNELKSYGYTVNTEVPNLYRSADIALLDNDGEIWVIECKISDISKAIEQSKTHMLSADKVFIGTPYKKTKEKTINKLKEAGIGLIYLMNDGSINIALKESNKNNPYKPIRDKLLQRIWEIA